jgi:putative ATP-dependent endonuclease of OLD family
MYLSQLKLWNFRKFGSIDSTSREPDLSVNFTDGLNLLVGENDSGKTAIVDAIKILVFTRSNEFIRLQSEDFHHPVGVDLPFSKLRIECHFAGMKDKEAKNFLEWMSIRTVSGVDELYLRVFLEAELKGNLVVSYDIKAGSDEEGTVLSAGARDLLRVTYLKPLRDAENELSPRKNSRLSQILDSHNAFLDKTGHPIKGAMAAANEAIVNYFKGINDAGDPVPDHEGKKITDTINTFLDHFFGRETLSMFRISSQSLKSILEKLELILERGNNGLGSHNLLFIAAELLLLTTVGYTGLRLVLIEEIEAHLHPQAQLRLIEYLTREANINAMQLIITTHSPVLASKVPVEKLILCKNNYAFSLSPDQTELAKGDYAFLARFLDATKANLFFAQGVILVEGDAENLLVPVIARIIGRDLTKYGVSVVNLGNTAFKRYSRIFLRTNPAKLLGVKVACITDNDIDLEAGLTTMQITDSRVAKAAVYDAQEVKTFVSPVKTMEYDLALGSFRREMYFASLVASKLKNSDKYGVTLAKVKEVRDASRANWSQWRAAGRTDAFIAKEIYSHINSNNLKSITAQYLGPILEKKSKKVDIKGRILADAQFKYIVDAILYVTEPLNPA